MANERLRAALLQREVTPNELAESVGVDPKTIERWIGGRVPYRRHRYRVASRLGIDEAYLWPGALAAEQVASASESEILVLYPHRWAVPRDIWGQLFDSAEEEIDVLVYSGMFIADDPGLLALFRAKAAQGVRVRILLGDPLSQNAADDHNAARPAPPIIPSPRTASDGQTAATTDHPPAPNDDPHAALWIALRRAPGHGLSVRELMAATEMGRTWVYNRLQEHASAGRAVQVSRGRWLATSEPDDDCDEMT
jgi:transcriptional regulator with XRE-family HTH domain